MREHLFAFASFALPLGFFVLSLVSGVEQIGFDFLLLVAYKKMGNQFQLTFMPCVVNYYLNSIFKLHTFMIVANKRVQSDLHSKLCCQLSTIA